MFKSNKVNYMTVIVKGVRDDDHEGRELMMEVVRRNCKMDRGWLARQSIRSEPTKMKRRSSRTSTSNLRRSTWAGSSVILSC